MDLGSKAGGPERLCQLLFVSGDMRDAVTRMHDFTEAVSVDGLATAHLVAPFYRTVVGTDRYVDELW